MRAEVGFRGRASTGLGTFDVAADGVIFTLTIGVTRVDFKFWAGTSLRVGGSFKVVLVVLSFCFTASKDDSLDGAVVTLLLEAMP